MWIYFSLNVIQFGGTYFFSLILAFGGRAKLEFSHTLKYRIPDIEQAFYEERNALQICSLLELRKRTMTETFLAIISSNINKIQRRSAIFHSGLLVSL
jgi:hypothetical protein